MVMIVQLITAESGNVVETMTHTREYTTGSHASAVELVAGIIHTIEAEDRL
jgi:hypothetical protein